MENERFFRREFADDEVFLQFLEAGIAAAVHGYRRDGANFHHQLLREGQVFASETHDSPFRFEIRKKVVSEGQN